MLGVTLQEKGGGLQMDYNLFQKILKFQKEHDMKLTGIVDDSLYEALKKHTEEEKKKTTSAPTASEETKKAETQTTIPEPAKTTDTPYTGFTPPENTKTREEMFESAAPTYINSDSAYPD
jgi:hypothetical protein